MAGRLSRLAPLAPFLLVVGTCAPARPDNLIIVLVDTLRADHLGYNGYGRPTSPNIDAVARRAVVFDNHHAHSSRTGPSVASLFTGLHPQSHGVMNPLTRWDAKGTLAEDQTTLAEILSGLGYRCHGLTANLNAGPRFGFGQGFETYDYVRSERAADINREALSFLQEVTKSTAPFFLYLHYMEPHSPYDTFGPHAGAFTDPSYAGPITGAHDQLDEIVAGTLKPDPTDVKRLEALYDQEIRYFDDHFGELVAYLESEGLLETSVLVFVSDHGEEFLDHGSALHGYTLYEEQLRVPCFVLDPRNPSPRRIATPTRHIDLLPTFLERLGLENDAGLQGRSLAGMMRGGEDSPAEPLLAETSLRAVRTVRLRSLTVGGWKLIETTLPDPRTELYRLSEDPGERDDRSKEQAGVTKEMIGHLRALQSSLPVGRGGRVELTVQEKDRLRALGYAE